MTRRAKVWVGVAAAIPVALYLGAIAYFVQAESSLVFMPSREIRMFDPAIGPRVRAVPLTSADGTRLSGRAVPSGAPGPWIFLLPANAGNTSTHQRWWRIVSAAGASLFTIDY